MKESKLQEFLHKELVDHQIVRTCLNCDHWCSAPTYRNKQTPANTCGKYKMIPPAEIIVYGCPNWQNMIPF